MLHFMSCLKYTRARWRAEKRNWKSYSEKWCIDMKISKRSLKRLQEIQKNWLLVLLRLWGKREWVLKCWISCAPRCNATVFNKHSKLQSSLFCFSHFAFWDLCSAWSPLRPEKTWDSLQPCLPWLQRLSSCKQVDSLMIVYEVESAERWHSMQYYCNTERISFGATTVEKTH